MATREQLREIVEAATLAPSGDNSQPWRFRLQTNAIEFHYLPERDHPLFNHERSGTLIALGAAIENAEIRARALGLGARTTLHDGGSCVAVMELTDAALGNEPLARAIPLRHSNRKAYAKRPLTSADKAALEEAVQGSAEVALRLIEPSPDDVARALTTMEEIALGNRILHKLFFGSIFFDRRENDMGRSGLYIGTLELPPPARALFRILRYWPVARALRTVGFPHKVAEMNAVQNASASAFGILTIEQGASQSYLAAGRVLERVWLTAAARGMALQIVTGLLFLARALEEPRITALFSEDEQQRIRKAYARIRQVEGSGRIPLLAFRVGYAEPPTAVSRRRPAEIVES